MQSGARHVATSFALAWLVVAAAMFGGMAQGAAASPLDRWAICAPSGNPAAGEDTPAHAAAACCIGLCAPAALDAPGSAAVTAPAPKSVAIALRTALPASAAASPLGLPGARAPPA
jgi:hypothetical protein